MKNKILVIDDEKDLGDAVVMLLETMGDNDVHFALSGKAGLALYREARAEGAPFDVVITDMHMQTVSGMDVLVAVKEMDPAAKVCIMSGKMTKEIEAAVRAYDGCSTLHKPASYQMLCQTLAEAFHLAPT